MVEQLFLYGVYSIHVRPIELSGARWDAEYEIRHREKAVKPWTTVGGDEAEAIAAAHQQAVDDIEHGAGIPKPAHSPDIPLKHCSQVARQEPRPRSASNAPCYACAVFIP
ncbi:MAG: FIG00454702: hypothetical protein [uncultured Paraburkholderia sp.]|nr:MAG: FIG00454702: hypothetical protein [uncultured Paraburkholderia sp.]CAH2942089.1 MAG: FIG00454702: hypothetical protein [uncultured Paraburkholderia sp.]